MAKNIISLQLINALGETIDLPINKKINLSSVKSGVYTLKINFETTTIVKQIIKI